MATTNFSSLSNGSTLSFDPINDILNFDDTNISAASLTLGYAGNYGKISLSAANKTIYLPVKVKLMDLTTANITFTDASQLIIGDNTVNTLTGGNGADYLLGLGGNDVLTGGAGDDILDGGKGADTMTGGTGSDTYIVDNIHDVVVESDSSNDIDTIQSSVSYTLPDGVENMLLTGKTNINATGNALDNLLTGNNGKNVLDGGLGADHMIGGLGNDTYIIDNAGDQVTEASNAGTDLLKVNISLAGGSYTLEDNVENATLINGVNFNLIGNGLGNTLKGNNQNNVLDGGAGIDTLIGGAGNDTYIIDLSSTGGFQDIISDSAGNDTLQLHGTSSNTKSVTWILTAAENIDASATGSSKLDFTGNAANNSMIGNGARNLLKGYAGNDTLDGREGNDVLAGGSGNDSLTGGGGNDQFVFETPLSLANVDTISDFQASEDSIYLSKNIFSKLKHAGGLSAANFVAGDQVHALDADDYILYDTTSGALFYDADGNGSHAAVQFATLVGVDPALAASNFFIV